MEGFNEADLKMEDGKTFKLNGYRVMVEVDAEKDTLQCGTLKLEVPDDYRKFSRAGIVRAIGNGVDSKLCDFKIGDHVIYDSHLKGIDILVDNKKHKIIEPEDISGILED